MLPGRRTGRCACAAPEVCGGELHGWLHHLWCGVFWCGVMAANHSFGESFLMHAIVTF
jgi:hypothetical protein